MNAISSRVLKHAPNVPVGTSGLSLVYDRAQVPQEVYDLLPKLLKGLALAPVIPAQRDVLLVSGLVAASAVMDRVGVEYGGKTYSPHLMILVVGPPGSGKGKVRRVHDFVSGVEAWLAEKSSAAHAEWEEAGGEKSGEPEPPRRSLLISPNASARAYFDRLAANGGVAFIAATEIDEFLGTASSEWGRLLNPLFREAFEHEPAMIDRAGFSAAVLEPKLAVVMAGTPEQALALIGSAENGLFSRFLILHLGRTSGWVTPRPTPSAREEQEATRRLATGLSEVHNALARRDGPLAVELTTDQWDALDGVLGELKSRVGANPDLMAFEASIHRGGVIAVRIATATAVLRAHEGGTDLAGLGSLTVTDDDVEAALTLTVTLLGHALEVYTALPKLPVLIGGNEGAASLLAALPEECLRRDAIEIADGLGIAKRTADKYLRLLRDEGWLIHSGKGVYRKAARHRISI